MTSNALSFAADEGWIGEALDRCSMSHDHQLRDEIAARSDWLATRSARRFSDRGEPFDDLVQEARIDLLKAIQRFEPDRNVPFGAYATPTIMGELRRHFRDRTWGFHVPRSAKDPIGAVTTAREDLSRELGRPPLISEIAARVDMSTDSVIEVLEANNAYRTHSIDRVDSGRVRSMDTALDAVLDRELLSSLLERLPPRQRSILEMRFLEESTQAQIAVCIGSSQVHVGRLIAASLAELNRHVVELGPGRGDSPDEKQQDRRQRGHDRGRLEARRARREHGLAPDGDGRSRNNGCGVTEERRGDDHRPPALVDG